MSVHDLDPGADMSIDAISNWPEDSASPFYEEDLDDFEDDLEDEDLTVEFAIDQRRSRLACVYTKGLWGYGIPELCTMPTEDFADGAQLDWGGLAFFLASGLIHLGHELMAVDHFSIPPYEGEFEGKPVKMWLDRQQPPDAALAVALGEEVDTVMRVDCSLWHPVLLGDG
jgi:hypothetical protein